MEEVYDILDIPIHLNEQSRYNHVYKNQQRTESKMDIEQKTNHPEMRL